MRNRGFIRLGGVILTVCAALSADVHPSAAADPFYFRWKVPGVGNAMMEIPSAGTPTDGSDAPADPAEEIPTWNTPSSLGEADAGAAVSINVQATGASSYSLVSGSLPGGVTLSASGLISGTASSVSSDTDYSFTIRATNSGGVTDRTFAFRVLRVESNKLVYAAAGSYSFTVPPGVTQIRAKSWGAGGGGGGRTLAGMTPAYGGGGGFVDATFQVTPGATIQITVSGAGASPSAANTGGGGGGASSVRNSSGLLIVAAGGGGGGMSIGNSLGGNGGGGGNGNGGDYSGGNAHGGAAAGLSAHGTGGTGDASGTNGTNLQGGKGGAGLSGSSISGGSGYAAGGMGGYNGGGGGGGGWFSGGGGGAKTGGGGAGGGAGSSYASVPATIQPASGRMPGGSADPDLPIQRAWGGTGVEQGNSSGSGRNGAVVLLYTPNS